MVPSSPPKAGWCVLLSSQILTEHLTPFHHTFLKELYVCIPLQNDSLQALDVDAEGNRPPLALECIVLHEKLGYTPPMAPRTGCPTFGGLSCLNLTQSEWCTVERGAARHRLARQPGRAADGLPDALHGGVQFPEYSGNHLGQAQGRGTGVC